MLAAIVGLAVVLVVGGRGSPRHDDFPWALDEVSKLHVATVGTLAGFAFTAVVLVVTLARQTSGIAKVALDTAIVMFWLHTCIGSAFLISYILHVRTSGDFVQHVHFSLASTLEYRTVFLSWAVIDGYRWSGAPAG